MHDSKDMWRRSRVGKLFLDSRVSIVESEGFNDITG